VKRLRFVGAVLVAVVMAGAAPMGDRVHALGRPASIDQDIEPVMAQGAQAGSSSSRPATLVTLKLTVVISRFDGDKKTGSLPFILMVVPGPIVQTKDGPIERDGDQTSLQMGAEVPVITSVLTPPQTVSSYQYRPVGTNIVASAKVVDDARFNVFLNVTDSQIMSDAGPGGAAARPDPAPRFQSFKSANRLILRDGQTVQFTAATDKTSGEVVKLDVTLNVIK
jgi:hypothetical protein